MSRYFLNSKHNNLIKNKENPYFLLLLENKKEILNTLREKDINDIEVKFTEGESYILYEIEWDTRKVKGVLSDTEKQIPLKEIILEIITKEWSNELESCIKNHIKNTSKIVIKEIAEEIRTQIYINTDEIYTGIDIISYQKNYIHWDYQKIIQSSESFFEYIEKKYNVYYTINQRLNEETNHNILKEKITSIIYEDMWIKNDIEMYNMAGTDRPENKLLSLINDNKVSNKDIISELLWDQELDLYMKRRATNTYNYMKHNIDKIIENITNSSPTFASDFIKRFNWNKRQQKFLYENYEVIENMIKGVWGSNIRENVNILSRLLCTIIDDQYVVNLTQIKQF